MTTVPLKTRRHAQDNIQTISVVIPTKDRKDDLVHTIESLLTQTRMPDEIMIVDQSCVPSVDPKTIPIQLVYIHAPHISGLTHARNVAMERARGDIWLFLDDDVILEREFVEELLVAYSPGVTGVSGIITNYTRPGISRRLFEDLFVRGPFHDDRQPIYWRAKTLRAGNLKRVKQFTGALMSFRADAVRHLRFDVNLTGGCLAEDIDFCARLPRDTVLQIAPNARLLHKRSAIGRPTTHWLDSHSQSSSYMRHRNWHRGVSDDLSFAWLQIGYALMAAVGSLKRGGSLEPFRAWRAGAQRGKNLGSRAPTLAPASFPKETTVQG